MSLNIENADRVMVITYQPAVLGNQREESEEMADFIGQIRTQVKGPV